MLTDLKLYSLANISIKSCLHLSTMPNPKGNPQNFEPAQPKGEEPMTATISFRATEKMKEDVKAQEDPPEFCRQAIQEKLDKDKKK